LDNFVKNSAYSLLSWYLAHNFGHTENEDPEVSRCEAEGSTANLADDSELQDVDRTLGDADSSSGDCCENQHQQGEGVIFLFSYMHLCG
jgi:hypothetical protein